MARYQSHKEKVTMFRGEVISLRELSKRAGLDVQTVRKRYKAGIRGEGLVARSKRTAT